MFDLTKRVRFDPTELDEPQKMTQARNLNEEALLARPPHWLRPERTMAGSPRSGRGKTKQRHSNSVENQTARSKKQEVPCIESFLRSAHGSLTVLFTVQLPGFVPRR